MWGVVASGREVLRYPCFLFSVLTFRPSEKSLDWGVGVGELVLDLLPSSVRSNSRVTPYLPKRFPAPPLFYL